MRSGYWLWWVPATWRWLCPLAGKVFVERHPHNHYLRLRFLDARMEGFHSEICVLVA